MSIIAVAAASGVGKSTFMRTFMKLVPGSTLLTSTTTRKRDTRDIHEGNAHEYEYLTREEFGALAKQGVFLDVFGEEYKSQYGTRERLFQDALASPRIYLAALFVPGVELFFEVAREELHREDRMHAVFLDLKDEDERLQRLGISGGRDSLRYEPELEKWRRAVQRSDLPFFILDASKPPEALVHQAINKFGVKTNA
jgi:guanylate kinase